ncbi:MAG: 4-aminobutyrate--2-oxoglutarate transaminase [Alicyclobacillaceae bacterium]|nr:4-aminobutyrate--2-oxoglutarate transaminase [Alicyclobacillaceae bacterium]
MFCVEERVTAVGSIHIRTPVPGPKSAEWFRRKGKSVADAVSVYAPVVVERAEGALIHDVDGNTFIDLAGGLGCLNVGHAHPRVVEAVEQQVRRFTHTDFSVVMYDAYVALAERLIPYIPGGGEKKGAFFNSGAEAVENAVKIARAYTGRPAVLCFEGAFHGRTLLAMTLTSKTVPYKAGFGPFAPEVYRVPYPDPYRAGDPVRAAEEALAALDRAFSALVAPREVAAAIVEPVLGEGGFIVPPKEFLSGLQERCRDYGILLIADEIQTGFGRTGHMFACEAFGLQPDLVCVGKSIAAGLPLSGVFGRKEILDAPGDGAVGGTYVGNPAACAAGLAVLDILESEGLIGRARSLGVLLKTRLDRWKERFPLAGDVRGMGAMMAVELVKNRKTREPAGPETAALLRRALERGVIAVKAGLYGNVVRFLMPLVIPEDQLNEALDVLEKELESVCAAVS